MRYLHLYTIIIRLLIVRSVQVNFTTDYGFIVLSFFLVHGGLTSWSLWTFCNKPCGNGTSERRRSCTNPIPMYGGRNCIGETLQLNECNTQPCIREFKTTFFCLTF